MIPPIQFRTVELSDRRFESEGLRHVTVKSPALSHRADLTVFSCPETEGLANVPLVLLLHGAYGSHWAWPLKGGAHRTAERLCKEGVIPPMVLAMPSDGLWGDGSGYLPFKTQNFERWILDEVPAAAALASPVLGPDSPVCIAGLSMGGFGALRLAAKYPHKFRAASGLSSATHLDQLLNYVEEARSSYTVPEEDCSLLETMQRNKPNLTPFRFDCGVLDPLLEPNRVLHQGLLEAAIPHVYEELPGGHDWTYWEAHLERTLRFFGKHLTS